MSGKKLADSEFRQWVENNRLHVVITYKFSAAEVYEEHSQFRSCKAISIALGGGGYSPDTTQITKGETVEWVNDDLTPHTVTSDSGGELNSSSIDVEATWRHRFTHPGTFAYFCTFHREMKGSVIVK